MSYKPLRGEIKNFLNFKSEKAKVEFEIHAKHKKENYTRFLLSYTGDEGDKISAYLLVPNGEGPFPGALINHQHNSEWQLGKSEVCGLAGDSLNAFGSHLANKVVVVLAPDSICFEDRRRTKSGLEKDENKDWLQHYNEMCYRLVKGDTLMRKVLSDASLGVSLLSSHPAVDSSRIGTLGHSYGGNIVLFLSALDERIKFACSSGAACSYQNKMSAGTGIEMAEVIPGFAEKFAISDLVKCIAPRNLLLVSATEDKYSKDANKVEEKGRKAYAALGEPDKLEHKRFKGSHQLTEKRFNYIVNWVANQCLKGEIK